MPREHGRVLTRIWRDPDFQRLTPSAQRLYILLLSQSNITNAGVLPLQVSKWAKGSVHTSVEDIEKALDELMVWRFVVVDDDTEECLVRSYMRNDGVANHPLIFKNALRCCQQTESAALRAVLAAELRRIGITGSSEMAEQLVPFESHSGPTQKPLKDSPEESHSNVTRMSTGQGKGAKGEGQDGKAVGPSAGVGVSVSGVGASEGGRAGHAIQGAADRRGEPTTPSASANCAWQSAKPRDRWP